DDWNGVTGSIKLFDVSGKIVLTRHNNEFNRNSLIQLPEPAARGIYFVEINSEINRFVGKVIVK
ncbi:T9SS type A sorting domain-containing protein, partial [Dolichospermum sp. ST_sed4]|nr:T9SS type A sorting domain-containing protein [Dolichospermum sp. ST_sed4]